jgi:anti-sigma regulatory factor (Ser/Thr protein kinase)
MQSDRVTQLLFRLSLPALPERLVLVRAIIQRTAETSGCSSELAQKLVIAVNEACMNIIQHAYKGGTSGQFMIEVSRSSQSLCFRLEDYADPIDLEKVKPRDLDDIRPGGLGVHFIREIMDTCQIGHLAENRGNYLEMVKIIE